MQFRFAPDADFSAFNAALVSAHGLPGFPARLAAEMFLRAAQLVEGPLHVWDPLCGSGSLLTAVAAYGGPRIASLWGSDLDSAALEVARQNLGLVDASLRSARLNHLVSRGRLTPAQAAEISAWPVIPAHVFEADALKTPPGAFHLPAAEGGEPVTVRPNVVVTDVPYGIQTHWDSTPARLVRALATAIDPDGVIAVAGPGRKVEVDAPTCGRMKAGTRAVALVKVSDLL